MSESPEKNPLINKLEQTEHFNRIVLESSPDCVKILDVAGRLQYMNYNGLCQMEIDDFSLFKNQLWWDLWGSDNKDLVEQAVAKALQGEANEFEACCATAKNTMKWWQVSVIPVATEDVSVQQILSISRDITAQKNAQDEIVRLNTLLEEKVRTRTEELLEKNIALEKSNAELAVFNHVASHDLQEPLRKIQTFSSLILETDAEPEKTKQYLGRILDATQRMRNLIDALGSFSASKHSEIHMKDCDLNAILADVTENMRQTIGQKHAAVTFAQLPVIKGSATLITQLFINLLENALKYSKADVAPRIHVSCDTKNALELDLPIANGASEFYVIAVTDNGIGFDNQYRQQIFEAFKRLHSKDKFLGTGIGLAICKTIIENHNGWIDATSDPELGTTFLLYFPKP